MVGVEERSRGVNTVDEEVEAAVRIELVVAEAEAEVDNYQADLSDQDPAEGLSSSGGLRGSMWSMAGSSSRAAPERLSGHDRCMSRPCSGL